MGFRLRDLEFEDENLSTTVSTLVISSRVGSVGVDVSSADTAGPPSSDYGTYKTVKARFWHWP